MRRVRDRLRPDRDRDRERRLLESEDFPDLLEELTFFLLDRLDNTRKTTIATKIDTTAAAILRPAES